VKEISMRPMIVYALVALPLVACNTVPSEVDGEFVPFQPERTELAVAQPAGRNALQAKVPFLQHSSEIDRAVVAEGLGLLCT
jgi:hypothetical protein